MALSMDEQRILDEIERALASADPGLASRMAAFGTPRSTLSGRMRRVRLLASLGTLLVVAAASLVVYALVPFRAATDRPAGGKSGASPSAPAMMAPSRATGQPSLQGRTATSASASSASASSASPRSASASPAAPGPSASKPSVAAGQPSSPVSRVPHAVRSQ